MTRSQYTLNTHLIHLYYNRYTNQKFYNFQAIGQGVKMVACFEEIDQWIENMERGHEICSLRSIHEYIECARKNNLEARYFPVISCGFIVYMDKIIFLALEKGGTRLSIDPIAT